MKGVTSRKGWLFRPGVRTTPGAINSGGALLSLAAFPPRSTTSGETRRLPRARGPARTRASPPSQTRTRILRDGAPDGRAFGLVFPTAIFAPARSVIKHATVTMVYRANIALFITARRHSQSDSVDACYLSYITRGRTGIRYGYFVNQAARLNVAVCGLGTARARETCGSLVDN